MKQFEILRNEVGDDTGGGGSSAGSGAQSLIGGAHQAPQETQKTDTQTPPATGGGAFDFRSVIGDDNRFAPDWIDKLPDDLKAHKEHFKKYADPLQALQHTLSLQQLLGKKADAVVIPGANASKEEWAPVLKRLGVPDSPEGYGLKAPEKLPEGVKVDEAELKEFAKTAHELGLTPQQVAKLQEYDLGRAAKMASGSMAQAQAMETAAFNEQQELLAKEWGNGAERGKKEALAERAALTFGFTAEDFKNEPLFRNAKFVMTLAKAGAAMSEDTLVKSSDIVTTGGLKAKANDVIGNKQNPLYDKYWSGDPDTVSQVQAWFRAG